MPTIPTPVPALPTPTPSRLDPTNFRARMDARLAADPAHTDAMNALASNVYGNAVEAAASATTAIAAQNSAAASSGAASVQAGAAAASAASAMNSPGTNGTSPTSSTIGLGSKTLATQAGKAWSVGQVVSIAVTAAPTVRMVGPITSYNGVTGSLTVNVEQVFGSGTFAAWTIAIGASFSELPSRAGNAGKVPVVGIDSASVAWDYADRAAAPPAVSIARATNLILQSEACDSSVSPWSLVGSTTRVGQTAGRRGQANGATVYSAGAGSSAIAQAVTLPAAGWYTLSVYARILSGALPSVGGLLVVDRDTDGDLMTVERASSGWPGALTYRWQRFEMPFYAASTSITVYLATDSANGAQFALCDAMVNAGRRAAIYAPTAGATASTPATPPTPLLSNGGMYSGWSASVSGGATLALVADGTMTPDGAIALRLAETNTVAAGVVRVLRATSALVSARVNVLSVLVRRDSVTRVYLLASGGGYSTSPTVHFNLETKTVDSVFAAQYAWIEDVDADWVLCHAVLDPTTGTSAANVAVGLTHSTGVQTHATIAGTGLWLGGVQLVEGYEPRPMVRTGASPTPLAHAPAAYRTVHHVDTTAGEIDIALPLPIADEWIDVVDVGRASGASRIRLQRGAASAIAGVAEDMDINIAGASIRLRADIDKGWVLA